MNYDVIIAGADRWASAAIRCTNDFRVALEQKDFRDRNCAEVHHRSALHAQQLGVASDELFGPTPITNCFTRAGQHASVPSDWFGSGAALGLSRAVMDEVPLRRAETSGVDVVENATAHDLIHEDRLVQGVLVKCDGRDYEYRAPITIDATGRSRVLAKKLRSTNGHTTGKVAPKLIAFKIHLEHTRVAEKTCEIYFYPGGYGGLSSVESGLSNLCFIVLLKR